MLRFPVPVALSHLGKEVEFLEMEWGSNHRSSEEDALSTPPRAHLAQHTPRCCGIIASLVCEKNELKILTPKKLYFIVKHIKQLIICA